MRLLLVLLFPALAASKNIFVSSPFDNFRIECPKKSGANELSVRMVESVGAKRQDIVFDMSCEGIEELYPWVNIPVGITEIDREDCYYSSMFDPILDEDTEYSCKNREYFAGITRLTDTRVQVLCCRLRSRIEFNCRETQFNKPIGLSRTTIIEGDNQLINALKVNDRGYIVRFCDMAPRNIPEIYDDIKVTTERPKTTKQNLKGKVQKQQVNPYSTRAPTTLTPGGFPQLPKVDAFGQLVPEYSPTKGPLMARINEPLTVPTTHPTTQSTTTRVPPTSAVPIAVTTTTEATTTTTTTQKPTTISTTTISTTTTPKPTTTTTKRPTTSTTTSTTTKAPTTTTEAAPTSASHEEEVSNSVEDSMEKIDADPVPTMEEPAPKEETTTPTHQKSVEDITMVEDLSRVTFNNDDFPKANEKKLAVPGKMKFAKNQLPLRPGASSNSEFVFLPSINHEGIRRAPVRTYRPHINLWDDEEDEMEEMYGQMGFTSSERKMRRKVTRAHRLPTESKEDSRMSDVSKEVLYQNMMKIPDRETLYLKEDARKLPPGARQDLPATRRNPDEETNSSPFENENEPKISKGPTSVYDRVDLQQAEDIEEVFNRLALHPETIRRAPVRNTEPDEARSEKTDRTRDGVKVHKMNNNEALVPVNDLVIFDSRYKERKDQLPTREALVPMMSPQFFGTDLTTKRTAPTTTTSVFVQETTALPTSSTTRVPTTTEYDPSNFYHTPRPKPPKKEKVLTFCTKDIAIRDERNMVIACGGELDVWVPSRCPAGTDCFVSSDSTYRICCPISKG